MAPKRTTRASSSQPVEAQKSTRASRKRRASDATDISDANVASSSQSVSVAPAKRRKRGRPAKHEAAEVIEEADELHDDREEIICDPPTRQQQQVQDTVDELDEDTIEVADPSSKHVSFGDGITDDDNRPSTATNLTPHPRKMTVKRRITFSPAAVNSKRVKAMIGRSSLPSELVQGEGDQQGSQDQEEEVDRIITDLQFAPLRAVLEERVRRRKALLHEQQEFDGDEDMLVLASQEELAYPDLPNSTTNGEFKATFTTRNSALFESKYNSQESSASRLSIGSSAQVLAEHERRRLEDAIVALSREAQDAKSQLQILTIELQALGFGSENNASILQSIRESFDYIRIALDTTLPDSVPDHVTTSDLIEILIANVKEFAARLRMQDRELHDDKTLITDLSNQIQGLLDRLADAEIRKSNLQEQWHKLDEANEHKERSMEELEEELDVAEQECANLRLQLQEKTTEVKTLGVDHVDTVKNLERLQLTLENYRSEETRLTSLISRMESEHKEVVTKMNIEREATVQDLENRLDEEVRLRSEVERTVDERQTDIADLELRFDETAAEREHLRTVLEQAKADFEQEVETRETVEADLEDKVVLITDLEKRVDRLEDELSTLNSELEQLRQVNETERRQREAAENDLDDRNAACEELNRKLLEQGKQANELRQKLFEVQQHHAQQVNELELLASDRDTRYQLDMTNEVTRREAADDLAQQRAASILDLESRLEEIELQMKAGLAERDERVAALEDIVAERDGEIEGLRIDLRAVEHDLERQRAEYDDRTEDLKGSVAALQETITLHETTISDLQQEASNTMTLHDSEIDDRNSQIADLHGKITDKQAEIAELENQKTGLERRVEEEAEQMLQLQSDKSDEIEALKEVLEDKQAKILVVEEKAVEADKRWNEVMAARDAEIEALQADATTDTETITTLTTRYSTLRDRLIDYVRRSSGVIGDLHASIRAAHAVAEVEGGAMQTEGEALVEELDATDMFGLVQVTKTTRTTVSSSSQASASASTSVKKGRGRKKRPIDSGIGMDAEELGDESMLAA